MLQLQKQILRFILRTSFEVRSFLFYTVDGDTSRNEEITDRCGNKTAYEYDEAGRTTKVTRNISTKQNSNNKNHPDSFCQGFVLQ